MVWQNIGQKPKAKKLKRVFWWRKVPPQETIMSNQTFSRSYLQGLPDKYKQEHIDALLALCVQEIQAAATDGETSYMYVIDTSRMKPYKSSYVITKDDMISAFQIKFPDCSISYEETVFGDDSYTKITQKGIIIDWA